jgi:hypothetical protein
MPAVRRAGHHHIVPADFAREHNAVAVERQIGVLELYEFLEIVCISHADGGLVFIGIAPRHVVSVLNPTHPRVVPVLERRHFFNVSLERNALGVNVPV